LAPAREVDAVLNGKSRKVTAADTEPWDGILWADGVLRVTGMGPDQG